jgi:hypothetical protein
VTVRGAGLPAINGSRARVCAARSLSFADV